MSYQLHNCTICEKQEIAPHIVSMWIQNGVLANAAHPGQFLHIECGDATAMPLRRPISICEANGDRLRIIFEVKGRGTTALAQKEGTLSVLGPLGNGFLADNAAHFCRPAIIGGGIGAYPLLFLAQKLKDANVYLGFRTKELVTLESEFKSATASLSLSTDDGTYGRHGFALEALEADLPEKQFDILYACGPKPMLRAVKAFAEAHALPCRLSLEERMGCGIGACLTCSCETPEEGATKYKRVCRNGPVFWAEEVIL